MTGPRRGRPLRTRLPVLVTAVLVCVCAVLAVTTVFAQRAALMGGLDDRVGDAVERDAAGAARHPELPRDLGFLTEGGRPAGDLAARVDARGRILSAAVVTENTSPRPLTADQADALGDVTPNGPPGTRTVPGLGTYRVAALDASGVRVVTGLPMDDVRDTLGDLARTEAVLAAVALTAACCASTAVIRRQLRPLGRVAATAADVSRAPLGPGPGTALPRVPERDTGPGSEAGQVGAALNRLIDRVEAALADRRRGEEQVRRSEERMRRFLADASHELRTPLASIAGYAELMSRGTGRVAPDPAWRRVDAESARMRGLVEDLLLLARLGERAPLQAVEVDMAAVVAEAAWDARAAGAGHVWRLELDPDAPVLVLGDLARLRQAVANLLANARAHTPAGTTVTATVGATAAACVVRVRDDGPGIPPEFLPAVFEPFTRADPSRTRTGSPGGGAGLGLAVVAAIATAHGGRAEAHSVPGRTEFTLELPAARRAQTDPARWEVPASGPAERPAERPADRPAGRAVLPRARERS
ncbi:sensor histidine kinase [Streptomyces sp. NPDC004262]